MLGLIDPATFLGGDMALDAEAAVAATERVGASLGLGAVDVAAGIHEIVNQNMAAAARMHAVEQGVDLRGVSLLAFGGAGPVHACGVAELLEAQRVIFPVNASVLSAFGTLVSPVRIDLARSMPRRLDAIDPAERDAMLEDLRAEGRRVLAAAGSSRAVRYRYGLDARYAGQGNEVTVWVAEGSAWTLDDAAVLAAFETEYRRIFGLTIPDVPVEIVTWRLAISADADPVEPNPVSAGTARSRSAPGRSCSAGRWTPSTPRCTAAANSAPATASADPPSSKNARRPPWYDPAGTSRSAPMAA